MRVHYPGVLMIPAILVMLGAMWLANSFGIMQFTRTWSLWPVSLIATGLEEIFLWATAKTR